MNKRLLTIAGTVLAVGLVFGMPGHAQALCQSTSLPTATAQATTPPDNGHGAYSYRPTVMLSGTDLDRCGGLTLWYKLDQNTYIGTTSNPAQLTIPWGYHTFSYYATDAVGHTSAVQTLTAIVDDQKKPVASAVVTPGSANGANGWYTTTPIVTLSGDDGAYGSGIKGIEYKFDFDAYHAYTGPISVPEGVHTLFYRADDNAGLVGDAVLNFKVDLGKPHLSYSVAIPKETTATTLHVEGYASDPLSGPPTVTVNGAAVAVDNTSWFQANVSLRAGSNQLRVVATDQAGNTMILVNTVIRRTGVVLGAEVSVPVVRSIDKRAIRFTNNAKFRQRLILTGENFQKDTIVLIGGKKVKSVRYALHDTMIIYLPVKNQGKGTFDVRVKGADGSSTTLRNALRIQ